MVIIGVDLGDARTGIAVSDVTGFLSGRAETIEEWDKDRLAKRIADISRLEKADEIVVGHPINMDATSGDRAQKSEEFAEKIRALVDIPVVLWDERGTTVTASRILSDAGKKRKKQRERVDAVAASIILQSYLDHKNSKRG